MLIHHQSVVPTMLGSPTGILYFCFSILVYLGPGQGYDIDKGATVMKSGELIGTSEIGLLATVGVMMVKVYPRLTVAVLSTGDELVEPTTQYLSHGQIRVSSCFMLLEAAIQQQCKTVDLGIAHDNEDLERILDYANSGGIDILFTSGGVSMGDRDFVKPSLARKGTIHFSKVLMKTGKRITFLDIHFTSTGESAGKKILCIWFAWKSCELFSLFQSFCCPR